MNLNDAIEGNCNDLNQFELFKELSPEIQKEYDGEQWDDLFIGIGNLTHETRQYRRGKVKVVTRVDGLTEILEILSTGGHLSEVLLRNLNQHYEAGRQMTEQPPFHGSRFAAFYLAQVGGVVSMENCDVEGYTLRNKVVFG